MADEQVKAQAIRACRDGTGDFGLSLARSIGDWNLCAYIINRWMDRLMLSELKDLAMNVLDQLPREAVAPYVSLVSVNRFMNGSFDGLPDDSPIWTPSVPAGASHHARAAGLADALTTQALLRWIGRFDKAHELALAWQPVAETQRRGRHGRGPDIVAFWNVHAGISHEFAGDREAARQRYADAWQLVDWDETGVVAWSAPARRAVHDAVRGHNADAALWLSRIPDGAPGVVGFDAFIPRTRYTAQLMLATDRLDLETADRMAMERDDAQDRYEFWFLGLWARCRALLAAGKPYDALAAYEEHAARPINVHSEHGITDPIVRTIRADIELALGRNTKAALVLEPVPADDVFASVPRARLQLSSGDAAAALATTETFLWQSADLPRVQRELQLIRAAAALETGQLDEAVAATRDALRSAVLHDDPRAFLTVSRATLAKVVDRVEGLGELVEEFDARGAAPIYPERGRLVHLSNRELVLLRAVGHSPTASIPALAAELVVSSNTVKTQMRSLFKKFEVGTRADLVTAAGRMGFLDPDS